jgi:membrane fusion protein
MSEPSFKHTAASISLREILRSEAFVESHRSLGKPARLLGVPTWTLCCFLLLVLAGTLAFMLTAHYARKETVPGQVVPTAGSFRIASAQSGIAEVVLVRDGDVVKAGTRLIGISSNSTLRNGESLADGIKLQQAAQKNAQEQQVKARLQQISEQIGELNARRASIAADIDQLQETREILRKRRGLQISDLDGFRQLASSGMAPRTLIRQHEDALLAIEQQIQQADRETARQRNQLLEMAPQLRRLQADASLARSEALTVKAELQERALTSEAQLSRYLTAPTDGRVTALQVRAGMPVTAGQTLAVVVPGNAGSSDAQLEVELWAPSRAIGFVKPGAAVRVMYDAFPYQTFGVGTGRVYEIAGTPVAPQELQAPVESREQLFRIRVRLDRETLEAYGRTWPLVPGMRLSADLVLEKQSVFDWLLAPVNAVRRRTP